MRILQIHKFDTHGGAARVAWDLHRQYGQAGHDAWMTVGERFSDDPRVLVVPHDAGRSRWTRRCLAGASRIGGSPPARVASRLLQFAAEPRRTIETLAGVEDFNYPATLRIPSLLDAPPSVIQAHNLHGGYFDLRVLPAWSGRFPVILTLHDAWLFSGHCAHSFDCERWREGCGRCPNLTTYPAVRRDATAWNWRRKQEIYERTRCYVATPSRWLMRRLEASMLATAAVERRIIPNGVDLQIFRPADRAAARVSLGLPIDRLVIVFAAAGLRANEWKDYAVLRRALEALGSDRSVRACIVGVGEDAAREQLGGIEMRFVAYRADAAHVSRYLQAADIYVHPARVDTFPNGVIEALATGTPVVASAVGGIPEQIDDGVTGRLVPAGDAPAMAACLRELMDGPEARRAMGEAAAAAARARFDVRAQARAYLEWFEEIVASRATAA